MKSIIAIIIWLWTGLAAQEGPVASSWLLPVRTTDRQNWQRVGLTDIGKFGELRKARPSIPAHLHTGVDIMRPAPERDGEPVFPAAEGRVISIRDDGPFAQIIVAHVLTNGQKIWTVYEHVSGIVVNVGSIVKPSIPMARFMNRDELNRHGWQFNHIHFEILKRPPRPIHPDPQRPYRFFSTYSLECITPADLNRMYYQPGIFLRQQWQNNAHGSTATTKKYPHDMTIEKGGIVAPLAFLCP
jgi:hypothetical protein